MSILIFDFETSRFSGNLPWHKDAYVVSLAIKHNCSGVWETAVFMFNHTTLPDAYKHYQTNIKQIQELFTNASVIVAHNLKFDLHWLRKLGIDTSKNKYWCTMVTEYLLSGQEYKFKDVSLALTAERREVTLKDDQVKSWWDNGYETDQIPLDVLIPYNEQDVECCHQIFTQQLACIKEENNLQLKIVQLRCESLRVTQEIEWNGMYTDIGLATKYSKEYAAQIQILTDRLHEVISRVLAIPSNVVLKLTSNDHLSAILFGGIVKYDGKEKVTRVLKNGTAKEYERNAKLDFITAGFGFIPAQNTANKKEGYYQTDIAQLQGLKRNTDEQCLLIESILELSRLEKMKGTYFDSIIERHIGGIVHPQVNECATSTGRYSCSSPNLQNVPRGSTSPVKEVYTTRFSE